MAESSDRALLPDETACVTAARDKGFVLHEGVRTPHSSAATLRPAITAIEGS